MRLCPLPILAILLAGPATAFADDVDLSTPIARAAEIRLRDLVPTLVLDTAAAHGVQVESNTSDAGAPFEATFGIVLPNFPNVEITLLVSERERATGIVARLFSMAAANELPGGSAADMEPLPGAECVGVIDQNMINCMVGSAAIQFTATNVMDDASIDYPATRALFASLPLDAYRKVFGQ